MLGRPVCGDGGHWDSAPRAPLSRSWRFTGPGAGLPPQKAPCPPEEALAAFAGHGVEVEAGGSVPADAADPRDVPVRVADRVGQGRAGGHDLHVWDSTESQVFISSTCHTFTL